MFLVTACINFERYIPKNYYSVHVQLQLRNASRAHVKNEAICYYCGTEQEMIEEETDMYYPVCCARSGCEKVKKYGK